MYSGSWPSSCENFIVGGSSSVLADNELVHRHGPSGRRGDGGAAVDTGRLLHAVVRCLVYYCDAASVRSLVYKSRSMARD